MRALFLGPRRYWLLWLAVVAGLWLLGAYGTHVRHFVPFSFAVLALAGLAVAAILATHRPDERVTREPYEPLIGDE